MYYLSNWTLHSVLNITRDLIEFQDAPVPDYTNQLADLRRSSAIGVELDVSENAAGVDSDRRYPDLCDIV